MFADNVSFFSSHPNKDIAEAAIQEAITIVEQAPQACPQRKP